MNNIRNITILTTWEVSQDFTESIDEKEKKEKIKSFFTWI
jgi:hypothetical protein